MISKTRTKNVKILSKWQIVSIPIIAILVWGFSILLLTVDDYFQTIENRPIVNVVSASPNCVQNNDTKLDPEEFPKFHEFCIAKTEKARNQIDLATRVRDIDEYGLFTHSREKEVQDTVDSYYVKLTECEHDLYYSTKEVCQ